MSDFVGSISLWAILPKYISKVMPGVKSATKHLKPIFLMFIPQIAIQVYTILDKSMLGFIVPDISETGIYEQSQNIIKIALALVTSLGIVMAPRITSLSVKGKKDEIRNELDKSFHLVWGLSLPICCGIIALAPNLVPWFLGDDFMRSIPVMQIGAFLLVAIGLSTITGTQYLVSIGEENKFTNSVIAGALTNVVGNFILIPHFGAIGAIISSVLAETVVFLVQYFYSRKEISIKLLFKHFTKCIIASLIMLAILYPISINIRSSIVNTVLLIALGAVIYAISLLIMKEEWAILYSKKAKDIFKGKLKK